MEPRNVELQQQQQQSSSSKKKKITTTISRASIQSLNPDTLCTIFASLNHYDLVHCSTVCKSWHNVINTSDLFKLQYHKLRKDAPNVGFVSISNTSIKMYLQEKAMEEHRLSLQKGSPSILQWNCHSVRVDQCRMNMGSVLTGLGDKVMRIWSLKSYRCLEEYSASDLPPLADFDFDESKIVGLVGTRICIWRRHGKRSVFPSGDGTFVRGLCMRYIDPEAVVGCEDGRVRVLDMYSRKCSRIIRMHEGPITCLALTDEQLVLSGSSLGSITVAGLSSDQSIASLKSSDCTGIKSVYFNPSSHLVFAGSAAGYSHCWDLRTMRPLWKTRVSSNVIYSMQHQRNDTSSLVVGGIDGVLRIIDQGTGETLASYVVHEGTPRAAPSEHGASFIEKKKARKLSGDANIDRLWKDTRPPITCLAVGMKKVVTIHNSKFIRLWKFNH